MMRRRTPTVLGIHAALVLICHAGAIGCAPPNGARTGSAGPGGSGKADDGTTGSRQCTTSFDCPLGQACGGGGQCKPWEDIALGATSPIDRASVDASPDLACPNRTSVPEGTKERYREALRRTAERLYGAERGQPGEREQRLSGLEDALEDPDKGLRIAEGLRERLRQLRDATEAAGRMTRRYQDLLETASPAEDRLVATARTQPRRAADQALEYLQDQYEAGVRVVVRSETGAGWAPHPMYEKDFEPRIGADGRAEDGLLYIAASELDRLFGDAQGFVDYRGVSRIFQVRKAIATQLGWLKEMQHRLEESQSDLFDLEAPSTGVRVGELLESTHNEDHLHKLRSLYEDLVHRATQKLGEVNAALHSTDDIVDFAEQHPRVRMETLGAAVKRDGALKMFAADCALRAYSENDAVFRYISWSATLLAGYSAVVIPLTFVATTAVGALASVALALGGGVLTALALGDLVFGGYAELTGPGEAPTPEFQDFERLVQSENPVELFAPLFDAVADGHWTASQASLVLQQVEDNPTLHDCILDLRPETLDRLDPTELNRACEQGSAR